MKKVTKILLLVLVAVMVAGMFAGCETTAQKIEKLAGTWTMVADDTEEQAESLLENFDLYEEEIALVDLSALDYVQIVEFTTEKTYRFAYDAEATEACVHTFLEGVFAQMYDGRTALDETYGEDFGAMSEAEFQQHYADLYGFDDFDTLVDEMAANAYDYDALAEDWETGTFTISGDDILCTITGESQAESLGYKIVGDNLTLIYGDGTEVYTRGN